MKSFKMSMSKRKKYYHNLWMHNPGCIIFAVISAIIFFITGGVLIKFIGYIPQFKDTAVMAAMYTSCVATAVIVWVIVRAIDMNIKYKTALPYFPYLNYSVTLKNNELIYKWWEERHPDMISFGRFKGGYEDWKGHKYVIKKTDISKVSMENGICTIYGEGLIMKPDWDCKKMFDFSDKETHPAEFSFPAAFECDDIRKEILNWLNT